LLIYGEQRLRQILTDYAQHYNEHRPPQRHLRRGLLRLPAARRCTASKKGRVLIMHAHHAMLRAAGEVAYCASMNSYTLVT
jgi:hypothetical protein